MAEIFSDTFKPVKTLTPRFGFLLLLWVTLVSVSALPADDKTADTYFQEGVTFFFKAMPKESVAAFDKVIELEPKAAPQLWQRGLALYYADEFQKGREQFELHQTANSNDVENAAWHFLCVARSRDVETARKNLIPISGDTRVPMKEVHDLFAGTGSEEAVLRAANVGDSQSETWRNQQCFAHLYLGLYHESLGDIEQAKRHLLKAATDYKMDHYMGKVAQVNVKLRGWE